MMNWPICFCVNHIICWIFNTIFNVKKLKIQHIKSSIWNFVNEMFYRSKFHFDECNTLLLCNTVVLINCQIILILLLTGIARSFVILIRSCIVTPIGTLFTVLYIFSRQLFILSSYEKWGKNAPLIFLNNSSARLLVLNATEALRGILTLTMNVVGSLVEQDRFVRVMVTKMVQRGRLMNDQQAIHDRVRKVVHRHLGCLHDVIMASFRVGDNYATIHRLDSNSVCRKLVNTTNVDVALCAAILKSSQCIHSFLSVF